MQPEPQYAMVHPLQITVAYYHLDTSVVFLLSQVVIYELV